jgi:hypothetical protein
MRPSSSAAKRRRREHVKVEYFGASGIRVE